MDKDKLKEQLKKDFKNRDRVISVLTKDGKFRIAAIRNTNTALTAMHRHNLPKLPAFLLARQLAAASMMAVFLKGEERVILEADGNGFIKKVFAEAIQVGEVRGYVDYDSNLINMKYDSLLQLFGEGTYRVSRILYSKTEPVTGIVPLQTGDIASDLSYYFFKSEQIPTLVILDTSFDDLDEIKMSSGMLIQAMPGTTNEDLIKIDEIVRGVDSINAFLEKDPNLENMLRKIIPYDFEIMKHYATDFYCRCSKDTFIDKLVTFGVNEIKQMQEQGQNELVCNYCNAHYYLDDEDFKKIITAIQAKQN
jgi:molecular chaperone Hsp33